MSYLFGASNYIGVGSAPAFASSFSIAAWIKPASVSARDLVYGCYTAGGDDVVLHITPGGATGSIRLDVPFATQLGRWRGPDDDIVFNNWQGIACTMDASSVANDPLLYLLTSPVATISSRTVTESITPIGAFVNTATDRYSGGVFGSYQYLGRIAYIQYWNTILTSVQLENALKNPGTIAAANLKHYWPFIIDANDGSGNGLNGSVAGATLDADNPTVGGGGGGGSSKPFYYRGTYGLN